MPSEPGMESLHTEMLSLLKEFHKICMENNIKYSLYAGTLLGAVRERGFIPWDDDIDVMLTREEYNRLLETLECKRNKYKASVIRIKKMPCLIPTWKTELSVWLDLFVCDYISERKLAKKCRIGLLMVLSATFLTHQTVTTTHAADYSRIKRICYFTAYYLGNLIPFQQKTKLFDWVSENVLCGNRTMIHLSNDIYSNMKLTYPQSMMREYIFTEFEGTEVMITKHYYEVLTSLYGEDYMTPKRMTTIHINSHAAERERCGELKP